MCGNNAHEAWCPLLNADGVNEQLLDEAEHDVRHYYSFYSIYKFCLDDSPANATCVQMLIRCKYFTEPLNFENDSKWFIFGQDSKFTLVYVTWNYILRWLGICYVTVMIYKY